MLLEWSLITSIFTHKYELNYRIVLEILMMQKKERREKKNKR